MKTVNLNDRTTFCASGDLVDELKTKISEGDIILNFAYTDYGGDFFDKMIIRYFKENHPESIVLETTGWNGENAFIFGELAKQLSESMESYLLGFEDTESFFSEMENEVRNEGIEYFKSGIDTDKFTVSEEIPDEFIEWVAGYCNVLNSGLDYSEDEMIEKAIETGFITPIKETE
jgi:hypothetical protein